MDLFATIPENFFSILASKNKRIYIDALFVLEQAFKEETIISKDNISDRLTNSLEMKIQNTDFSEDSDGDLTDNSNVTAKVSFLIRKLQQTGWIEFEMPSNSFEEFVVLPDYTIKFLKFMVDVTNNKQNDFTTYSYNTYSALKTANECGKQIENPGQKYNYEYIEQTYYAIVSAYTNTNNLKDELNSLYNNLGKLYKKMCETDNLNDTLEQLFGEYKNYKDSRIFPRFTQDSVIRYKGNIVELLNDILADSNLLNAVATTMSTRIKSQQQDELLHDLTEKSRSVINIYENIDEIVQQIHEKDVAYLKAAINRIQYLLTNDKELKGKLVNIIKNSNNEKVAELMQNSVNLSRQEYICEGSLYNRSAKKHDASAPLPIKEQTITDPGQAERIVNSFKHTYSSKEINDFMKKNFAGKSFINSDEVVLNDTNDLILLILATIRADERNKSFYTVEATNEVVENNGYTIPKMKFIRKNNIEGS